MQLEIKIFDFLFILFQLMHFEINIFLTKHFFLSWCSLRNGSRSSQSCASPGETRSFVFTATILSLSYYLLYFWQHFHLCHPVTRKSNIFLATLLPLAYAETQSIIFLAILLSLANGENAIYHISDNIFLAVQDSSISDIVGRSVCRSVCLSQLTIRA